MRDSIPADRPYVFLSLLPETAARAVELLRAELAPASAASVLDAPVRGIDFFAARGDLAAQLDVWWERHVPSDGQPVLLVMHEPGLERHLSGPDAEIVVGIAREDDRRRYAGLAHTHPILVDGPLDLARHVIDAFPCFLRQEGPVGPEPPMPAPEVLFMPRAERRGPAQVPPAQPPSRSWTTDLPDLFSELAAIDLSVPDGVRSPDRTEALSRASLFEGGTPPFRPTTRETRAAGTPLFEGRRERAPASPSGQRRGFWPVVLLFRRRRALPIPREIGDLVLGLHPAPLVVVPARKGGVGKTVTAGAVAQVVGYALGETTGSAAIVDQNIGNPDQWGRLDIPATAGTVRQLMAALSSGLELPPTPAWAKTPALAVYPEDRGSVEAYPPGLVQRFVHHLRERHVFMVVDLPNRLPDYSSAEAAICAAYIDLADLVILPTTDDPSALLGVMEYLETPSMRNKPVVVSYIVSTDRQLRRHPVVVELLDEIRKRVFAIEMVPKSEKATLAIVKGMSILDISPKLRDAYIRVAATAVRALAAG